MAIYNPESLSAEEFINHDEILETLQYAEANKNNIELIDSILEKARPKHYADGRTMHCPGLTHREASVLLACDIPEKIEEIYKLANEIKLSFYGNRIVMFAPLYLSNYCVNGCVYCPYHLKNKSIARKKLTQREIRDEVIALQDMGHKRLAIEAGEDPVHNPIEYILESIKTIYSVHHKNGDIHRAVITTLNIAQKLLPFFSVPAYYGRFLGFFVLLAISWRTFLAHKLKINASIIKSEHKAFRKFVYCDTTHAAIRERTGEAASAVGTDRAGLSIPVR